MLRYAIVGFGGLGKIHCKNLLSIEKESGDIQRVAICGQDLKNATKSSQINLGNTSLDDIDFSKYNLYETYQELFEKEELDFVVSALPTVLHKDFSVYALNHGVHVFSEKPMALSFEDCKEMAECAIKNDKVLMIGQCLRFSGAYMKVKEYVDSKEYGKPLRAELRRYSSTPLWGFNRWHLDRKQSGGFPIDMHVHDVDIINHFFGLPKSVTSHATHNKAEFENIFTTYEYDDIFVTSAADWSLPQKYPFKATLLLQFEKALLEILGDNITIYTDDDIIKPEIDKEDYFMKEMKEFVDCVTSERWSKVASCMSVMDSMKIAYAEIESAEQKGKKVKI